MEFINVSYFKKQPLHLQKILTDSGALPVIENCIVTWDAIHEPCPTCLGSGLVSNNSCVDCGDNETESRGSGRKYKYIIHEGSSRSGKTFLMIDCVDRYARENENKRITVWRDTKTDCKKTVLTDTLKHLKKTKRYKVNQNFNKTESIFLYEKGSTVEIHGTDDEETVHGLTQDAAWLNEPYKISKDTFDQIDQRTSDFIFIDWNPKKSHWIEDLKRNKRAIVIHSTFEGNPFCPPEQRKKIQAYQPVKLCDVVVNKIMPEYEANVYDVVKNNLKLTEKQIRELSRCKQNELQRSANAYKWQVYGLGLKSEKPNRIFNWNEISLEEYNKIECPIYVGVDWGKVDPWGILEVKYYDNNLYLKELNYQSETEIRSKLTLTEIAQIGTDEDGIVTWMFKKLGISKKVQVVCDSNRLNKIALLRTEGWNADPASKPGGSILDGIDALEDMNVFYTSCSENIKYEQENYSRAVDKSGHVLDDPEDRDNHLIDPTRYVVTHLQRNGIIKKV